MLNSLYLIFIQPIEYLLAFLYQFFYKITDSEIQTILLISLTINILLIPIYNTFDYWQIQDRLKEHKMRPKLQMIKRSFVGQERFTMLKTLYRQFNYSPIYGIRNSFGFLLQIPFFIAAYQFLSHNPELSNTSAGIFDNLSEPDHLIKLGTIQINVLPIVMTVINLWSGFIYCKTSMLKDKIQIVTIAIIFFVLLYNSPAALVLYWTFNNIFSLFKNAWHINKPVDIKIKKFIQTQRALPYLSTTLFITIAYLYFPSKLIFSDPGIFSIENGATLLISNYLSFLSIGLFTIYALKYFLHGLSKTIDISLFLLAVFSLLTAIYTPFDTGAIDHFTIPNISQGLGKLSTRLLVDLVILLTIVVLYRILTIHVKKIILVASNICILILSTIIIYQLPQLIKNDEKGLEILPSYLESMNILSQNHPNIIVIMLDGFTNPHFREILKLNPEFSEDFLGFTWYSNTVSVGSNTFMATPAIIGGHNLAPDILNKQQDVISIFDSMEQGYANLAKILNTNNYYTSFMNLPYGSCANITEKYQANNSTNKYCTEYQNNENDLNKYYQDNIKLIINSEEPLKTLPRLNLFGTYFSIPYSLRGKFYTYTQEFINEPNTIPLGSYTFLPSFFELAQYKKTDSAIFKYIASNYTHAPWHISDSSCSIQTTTTDSQFFTEYCAIKDISKLLYNLKKHNIYDNTMIILTSDHNFNSTDLIIKNDGNTDHFPSRAFSLLLIKDFNSDSSFVESTNFMSNADVPSIICQQLPDCEIFPPDPRYSNNTNRKLIHSSGNWHPDRHGTNYYNIDEQWEITGDMHKYNNWRKLK